MNDTKQPKEKIAWILAGGAARTVYTAGSLYAVCQLHPKQPDIIIACSGSAATSLCYVTGQYETIKNVWCKALSTKKFVHFWRFWKIVDIDYLIDIVLKKYNPLDMAKVAASPIKILFPLTNFKTGQLEYFSNTDAVDTWEVLRAAKSVPFFTNLFHIQGVTINGKDYSDSTASASYQPHLAKAIQEGATKILIFDSWHADDNRGNLVFSKFLAKVRNKTFRKNQLDYIQQIAHFVPPPNASLTYLIPKTNLNMTPWDIDNANANAVFTRGYTDTLQNEALQTFLQ